MTDSVSDVVVDEVVTTDAAVEDKTTLLNEEEKVEDTASKEVKTDEEDKEDGKEDKDEKSDVPEEYEFQFPEDMEVDETTLGTFKEWAKDHKISQDAAQELINMQTSLMEKVAHRQVDVWNKMTEEWATASKNDEEFGGKAFQDSVKTAKVALDTYGSDGLREVLDTTGAGNHPEVIRFFYKIGKALSEDKIITGSNNANVEKSAAKILFPNMN